MALTKAIDLQVGVKPIFPAMVHRSAYEGPCRVGTEDTLAPAADVARGQTRYAAFTEGLSNRLGSQAEVLEPVYFSFEDDWLVDGSQYDSIERDLDRTDCFLVAAGTALSQFVATQIGIRYKKPTVMVGGESDPNLPMGCDAVSHLRSLGLEGHVLLDDDELREMISLMQVRKALAHTRILRVTEHTFDQVNGNYDSLQAFEERLGVTSTDLSIAAFVEEMDRVASSSEEMASLACETDGLIAQAAKTHMSRESVLQSMVFYRATRNLLARLNCNAFAINCFEICPDGRIANQRKAVPCLTHTLLKDAGIPSACEGDINVLLAIAAITYLTHQSSHMGNLYMVNREKNILGVLHDVPGRFMRGYDQPALPFEIRNFTLGGWGATVRYDFARDKGQAVTVARFDPTASRLMATRGTLIGCMGFDRPSCSLEALIQVDDVAAFFRQAANFGNHSVVVYGDQVQRLTALGQLVGFEVVSGC